MSLLRQVGSSLQEEVSQAQDRDKPTKPARLASHLAFVSFLGICYICCSAGLISYNKFLIHEGRFPYAVCLVLIHTGFCSGLCACLYLVRPQLLPSLSDPEQRVAIDRDLFLKGALPIAVLFSIQLVLSNTAYLHSSVAFLQMMKEANLVLVYTFSLMAALERFDWCSVRVLAVVVVATLLTIHGEVNFSLLGFTLQVSSQFFESLKIVLQAMLLCNAGKKLDALTYVLLVMPLCFVVLSNLLFVLLFVWPNEHFPTPQWSDMVAWWPHLLANACLAFSLNVVIALFVKHSSAVAFILTGILKDSMIVCAGGLLLHEVVSLLQVLGFTLQLCTILTWSLMKTFPQQFEDGVLPGLCSVILGYHGAWPLMGARGKDPGYGAADGGLRDPSKC